VAAPEEGADTNAEVGVLAADAEAEALLRPLPDRSRPKPTARVAGVFTCVAVPVVAAVAVAETALLAVAVLRPESRRSSAASLLRLEATGTGTG
jgi:hypothetical protein